MEIMYYDNRKPAVEQVIELYMQAAMPRPLHDIKRMQQMFDHASLIITAWHGDKLVGICRSVTDWFWCCYVPDLAVHPVYKRSGIGKKLLALTQEKVSDQCMILLLSVPSATEYYPKVGFAKDDRAFTINRTK
jgi:N-acetylglutamate synthase-like GNAT family acetyltransferase